MSARHQPFRGDPDHHLSSFAMAREISGPELESRLPGDLLPNAPITERVKELRLQILARADDLPKAKSGDLPGEQNGDQSKELTSNDAMRIAGQLVVDVAPLLFVPAARFKVVLTGDEERLGQLASRYTNLVRVTPEMHDDFKPLWEAVESRGCVLTRKWKATYDGCAPQFDRDAGYLTATELQLVKGFGRFLEDSSSAPKFGRLQKPTRLLYLEKYEPIGNSGLVWGPDGEPVIAFTESDRRGAPFLVRGTSSVYLEKVKRHLAANASEMDPHDVDARRRLLAQALPWAQNCERNRREYGTEGAESMNRALTDQFKAWIIDNFPRSRRPVN